MEAVRSGARVSAVQQQRSAGEQLPLALVSEGSTVRVLKVRGALELRQHLQELGFVPGANVDVVARAGRDVLVSVKGSSIALGRDMALRIITT
ncbi:iron transporter FeoA [Olsenella sp. HMSC062G07]|nr:iron transporter FeoA [Olsenella sp. HMSC062G07]